MSPVPANRIAPPPATRTTTPKDRRPATRTGAPPAAAPASAKARRSPLLWAIPVLALAGLGAGAWLLLRRSTSTALPPPGSTAATPAPAPVETVKVVERTPAETVRLSDRTGSTPDRPTRTTETRSPPQTKTAYSLAAARAIARRVRAVSAGATPQELAAGDADAAAAEALARDGKYGEATARLTRALERWSTAEAGAQGRPRRGGFGGGGQGLQGEVEQVAAEFADAFSAKSLPRMRVVYPRMTDEQAQQWGQEFLGMRDVTMQLHATDVNRQGPAEAQATLTGSYDYTEMQGGTSGSRAVSWQATLRLGAMGWRIIALR